MSPFCTIWDDGRVLDMTRNSRLAAGWLALLAGGLTACSSSSSAPSWAAALGSGVTVAAPAQTGPGNGSPAAAVEGLIAAVQAKRYTAGCAYVEPSAQASCRSAEAGVPASGAPSVKNPAIGYVVIHGNQALAGTTGTFCVPDQTPKCYTNTDPAAIFSTGKSFAALWTQTNTSSSGNVYMLVPCIKTAGKWYLESSS